MIGLENQFVVFLRVAVYTGFTVYDKHLGGGGAKLKVQPSYCLHRHDCMLGNSF